MLKTFNSVKSDMVKECFLEMKLSERGQTKKLEYCVKQNKNDACKQQEHENFRQKKKTDKQKMHNQHTAAQSFEISEPYRLFGGNQRH